MRIAGGHGRIAGGCRTCGGGGSRRWCRGDDAVLGIPQPKPLDASLIEDTLDVHSGRGFLSRTAFIFVFICRTHSTSESWLWRQQILGQSETRGNMSAHSAIRRTAATRVYPTWGSFGRAKVTRHNSRVHSAAGKLTVAGNGHGVIVGCLQQYRKRWGFVRLAINRAAWPHALHGKQQQ